MKKTIIVAIVMMVLVLQGCIVKSVHPFFKESDVVYKKELEGEWTDGEKNRWRIHQNPYKPNSYELHFAKNGREVSLIGHLFTINGDMYLDMMPVSDNTEEALVFDLHMVPTHSISRVTTLTENQVVINWFNEEWLREMFTNNKIKISHEIILDENPKSPDDGLYLLTASTDELQKFVAKYGNDEKAYDSDLQLLLTK